MSVMPSEVASLIIPLENSSLLVPNSCVAEIVPYATTETAEDAPEWVIGNVSWRDLPLPCLSFEKLIGAIEGEVAVAERIAIFNTLGEDFEKRFYGIVINGIPRLARITEQEIVEEEAEKSAFEKMKVQINGEPCTIPDLEAVEKLLSTASL